MSAFCLCPGRSSRFETSLLVAVCCGLATIASFADEPARVAPKKAKAVKVPTSQDWKIEIIPGPAIGPSPVPKAEMAAKQAMQVAESKPAASEVVSEIEMADAEAGSSAGITPAAYIEVYNSIPFRRSEYLANPSYRHEATIEILLGQIRPKTVVNVTGPSPTCCSPLPATLVRWFSPWGTNSFDYRNSRYRP
ncbi:MAG: hypothetical protein ACKV2Q_10185 [Planctomycetaceae bacterium]